ncbi:Bug family tripartite tricarboxylate transporter substrate binding protein [Roseomonas sp. CCTCC AB2023176]|uniref:Bug family tripartite tricarboxylate transporter substrate binding protein n=1 Tax=Roseomonas sp. CCTCC AB2023176 TaxID=3342640 RepID=UPI0035DA15A7
MQPILSRRATSSLLALPALITGRPARAQWHPTRPVRLIVPFPPGQANDIFARIIAERANEGAFAGGRIVVENRGGAGGTIGMQSVVVAPPDGHTLVFGSLATLAINPAIMRGVPYDPERDFAPVVRVFEGHLVLVVPAQGPHADVASLIKEVKAGGTDYASSGPGSTQHMGAELFLQGLGARATHVPYRGSGPALADVATGAVDFAFESGASAMPMVRAGLLRALAVSSAARQPALPEVPTVAEAAGLPGYAVLGSGGILAPARTPQAVLAGLYEGLAAALADPTVRARITEAAATPIAEGPDPFAAFIRSELAKWREVARVGDIRLE